MEAELALAADDIVGERAVWDDRRERLIWVDIIGRRIHAYDPTTARYQLWSETGRTTSIGLRADDGAIVGMERHVCLWDWQGQPLPVAEVEPDRPRRRGGRLKCANPRGSVATAVELPCT